MPCTASMCAPLAPFAASLSAFRSCFETIAEVMGLDWIQDSSLLTWATVSVALLIVGSKALSRTTSAEMAR